MNDNGQYTHWRSVFGRIRRNSDCSHLWPFLIQNNGVIFPPYLPRLQQSLVSPHLLLCTRLPALCACISKCQRWRAFVDLALVQEVSVLSPPNLFTHSTEHREREREQLLIRTNSFVSYSLILSSSQFLFLWPARTHQKLYRQTPEHLCMSPCSVFECVYARLWVWFWERGIMIMQHIQIIHRGISSVLYKSVTLGRSQPEWWRGPTPPFVFLSHSLHSHRVPTALQHKRNVPF